ncbi:tetratricopeptide repeat protein [Cytophagaceae bacterium DM2B3-1]|uniref:Tetratricopeptide repeat protein n=1 Tax=Xanthocytophaga flava TaxID=3048013 RepID=A0ABT7CVW7_9BACT|nr:tetratricopeptide repeat protein [Xanthocytophaga flavus]MDJ1497877.1 tetratricopeptide repeat protein [Xanthocytophaga flavus]
MYKIRQFLLSYSILSLLGIAGFAQELTVKEGAEISYQAKNAIVELQDLLNFVTFADLPPNELKDVIANSYSSSKNQIFYTKDVVLEDDIDPAHKLGNTKDLSAEKYLNTLDVFYEKTIDASITFSDIKVSNVKKKDFIYVKVYFESHFGSKYKKSGVGYSPTKRIAQIRAEKVGTRWKAKIVGISFYDPNSPLEGHENDVALLAGPSEETGASGNTGGVASQKDIQEAVSKYMREREEADKKEWESEYLQAIQRADLAFSTEDYLAAKDAYLAAAEVYPFRTYPKIRINEVNRIIATYFSYDELKKKGDIAKNFRDYESSIEYYRKALNAKPEMLSTLDPEIKRLSNFVQEISGLKTQFEAKKYKDVIEQTDDLIKQKKKQKAINNYPELYLLRGKSYLQANEKKAAEKAIEDFNEAIALDQNYLEARLARADLNETRRNDVVSAIADYDIITKAIDPLNPAYHAKKAELKEKVNNIKGALEDYDKAIALAPKRGLYPYQKALVLIKIKDFTAAKENLEKSIRVEPEFAKAYYQRGMLWMEVSKLKEAAADFNKAEALGLESALVVNIQAKAIKFYDEGILAMKQNDWLKAQKSLGNAVAIRPKYAAAWFMQGQLWEKQGNYKKAIEQYTQALQVNERYKEAYYARGMARIQLGNSADALEDFSTAVELEPTYIDGLKGRGFAYTHSKKYTEAKADLTKAINLTLPLLSQAQKDKKNEAKANVLSFKTQLAELYSMLGYVRYLSGESNAGLEDVKKGLDYADNYADAYRYRGLIYQQQGDHKKAISDFEDAIKRNSKNYLAYRDRAVSYLAMDKMNEALSDLNTVIKADTQAVAKDAIFTRGIVYAHQNKYNEALQDMQAFMKKYPESADAHFYSELGFVYLNLSNATEALKQFENALKIENPYAQAQYGMACTYAKQNQWENALAWLETSFKTGKMNKDQVKQDEERYLKNLRDNKDYRKKYESLKKNYLK